MENKDISLMIGNVGFNYRVAALVECDDMILLHKPNDWDFWNLPGGRVKTTEPSVKALERELEEEIGYKLEGFKLIHFAEIFFMLQGKIAHDLLLVYKVSLSKEHPLIKLKEFIAKDRNDIIYRWFKKEEVKDIKCLPELIYFLTNKKDEEFLHTVE